MENKTEESVEPQVVPEIMKCEWETGVNVYGDLYIFINDNQFENKILSMEVFTSQSKKDAQAICTAINNTYGKGINPEAVPDLVEAIKDLLLHCDELEANKKYTGDFVHISIVRERLQQALKKAEL